MSVIIREIQTKNILTKSDLPVGDRSLNPYVGCEHACKYCYACYMNRFTGHTEPWGTYVDVKMWKPLLHTERYAGEEIFLGSVTDPYQPCEERYRRTRAALEELAGSGAKISIATKSDLVMRDMDILKRFSDARVSWSINTLDEDLKNDMDNAVSIERRFAAMKAFHDAGIRTTCFISPIFPGLTDVERIIERARDKCNLIWLEDLNLRGAFKPVIMRYIAEKHPELLPLYRDIYDRKIRAYWQWLDGEIGAYAEREGLEYMTAVDNIERPFDAPPVIVNFFYHGEIKKSAKKRQNLA